MIRRRAAPGPGAGLAWPARSLRTIVGFPPGGAVDIPGRLIADMLTPRLGQPVGLRSAAFSAVRGLLDVGNSWAKLSGPDIKSRLGPPDYANAGEIAAVLARAAPERVVRGSDWPHPTEPSDAEPDDRSLLHLLRSWVPDAAARPRVLVGNPAALYGFDTAT
ncbi:MULTISPECIES: amidohydrolase family protein [Roseomonadaceae]|uniref:Amidohydrolase family protein n=1 Tax=Falsiroseomonas oleicola TaxID=2801474 RepID=A0ABS6H6X6_9PROT|nr:amidohydrolase family protein [Roseomonas oleicola]MBU8544440.1 amidohydrolase family protein [Roseomonas oleicola]